MMLQKCERICKTPFIHADLIVGLQKGLALIQLFFQNLPKAHRRPDGENERSDAKRRATFSADAPA